MTSQIRDEIMRRAASYRERVTAIRQDPTLSPLGKRRTLEQAYNETQPEVDRLKQQLGKTEHQSRQALERRLFGLPAGASSSDAISYRDAVDRVSSIRDPQVLGELMERAASTGDDMLLRAAFGHAYQQTRNPLVSDQWDGLVGEYAEQNPGARLDLEELNQATRPYSRTQQFAEKVAMTVVRPQELDVPEGNASDQAPDQPESVGVGGPANLWNLG